MIEDYTFLEPDFLECSISRPRIMLDVSHPKFKYLVRYCRRRRINLYAFLDKLLPCLVSD